MTERVVSARLDVDITAASTLEFQIAVAPHPGAQVAETLSFVLDGKTVEAHEVSGAHGNRIHVLEAPVGNLQVYYDATVTGNAEPSPVTDLDRSVYLRPSRYAEADKFFGFAATEFGSESDDAVLLSEVSDWVGRRLHYVPGAAIPSTVRRTRCSPVPACAVTTRTWSSRCCAR